jgi:HTH-type transcriptional regulator, competence development regulator
VSIGRRIRELRRQRNLTQRQLAARAGLDSTYLSKIENNRLEHTPSIKAIQDLARALDVDELELMELANKLPSALEVIARDKEALRFFRRASETVKSPEQWRELHAFLDRQEQRGETEREGRRR